MAAASTDNRKVALITGVTGQVNLSYTMYVILMCLIVPKTPLSSSRIKGTFL